MARTIESSKRVLKYFPLLPKQASPKNPPHHTTSHIHKEFSGSDIEPLLIPIAGNITLMSAKYRPLARRVHLLDHQDLGFCISTP
ncbi:hypothetical protein HBZC1_00200 [Helicobacter bizzozeronii CIII-1]|uniref:Uncharacterized protein n=1 Tax=Helicobacter bizzozeronii (strain CIII-1) TaxID=1002804 RepID=F8KQK2_HELBC|nr:hypothetical protein HBZC1_00200 [Helicobacter bizzozeronii CIII-1]